MAQGKTKGLQTKAPSSRHAQKAAANTKKGKKTIAPKKAPLVKQAQMHQALSAKISRSIEGQMVAAASSGKLTIMKNSIPHHAEGSSSSKGPKPKSGK